MSSKMAEDELNLCYHLQKLYYSSGQRNKEFYDTIAKKISVYHCSSYTRICLTIICNNNQNIII